MENKGTIKISGGTSFFGLLTIAFIVLKLTGFITWSWLWVLAPLWVGFAIGLAILAATAAIFLVGFLIILIFDR